jgi:hypothetical protein
MGATILAIRFGTLAQNRRLAGFRPPRPRVSRPHQRQEHGALHGRRVGSVPRRLGLSESALPPGLHEVCDAIANENETRADDKASHRVSLSAANLKPSSGADHEPQADKRRCFRGQPKLAARLARAFFGCKPIPPMSM